MVSSTFAPSLKVLRNKLKYGNIGSLLASGRKGVRYSETKTKLFYLDSLADSVGLSEADVQDGGILMDKLLELEDLSQIAKLRWNADVDKN